jgi:hypothetical protein
LWVLELNHRLGISFLFLHTNSVLYQSGRHVVCILTSSNYTSTYCIINHQGLPNLKFLYTIQPSLIHSEFYTMGLNDGVDCSRNYSLSI